MKRGELQLLDFLRKKNLYSFQEEVILSLVSYHQ